MKRKTRKFASGGDIITGLGAVLVGKALYDEYKKGKGGDKDDDYTRRVKEFGVKGKFPEEKSEEKAAPKREEYVAADKEENDAKKEALSRGMQYKKPEGPTAVEKVSPVRNKKPVVAPKADAAPKAGVAPKTATSRSFAPDKKEGAASKPYPIQSKPNEERTTKTSPMMVKDVAEKKATDLSVPKGLDLKGTNKTVYGTDTTSLFQKKAAQERAEAEEKAKKKAKDAAQAKEFRERSLQPMKKGGAVKASKMGSVKTAKPTMRSASSRADGIAIRGKTRA